MTVSFSLTKMERRPASDLLPSQHTPEALAINQWFEDLSYYETTLEQMAQSKLDDSFREELKAIEQWFAVLSDPERTSALYALLKHTTPVQVRFFITVLQQMASKDSLGPAGVPMNPGVIGGGIKHSSVPAPVKGTDLDLLSIATGNSLRISLEAGHPKTPVDAAIAQANWSTSNNAHGPISPLLAGNPVGSGIPSQQPIQAQQAVGAGQVRLSPMIQPRTFSAHPGDGWGHVNLAASGRSRSGVGGAGTASSDYSDYDEYGNQSGSGSYKEKGKIPESIDLSLLNDVPSWLKSLRLHKYAVVFDGCTWRDMVKMTDAELEAKGVLALGARNKLLKVFELVKAECAKNGIAV